MTQPLLTRQGLRALRGLAGRRSALLFDLDGTLAPIVLRPEDARVPASTAVRLRSLSKLWPIAVLTGRSVDDARDRLGFEPHGLFGNHGAERHGSAGGSGALSLKLARALDPLRAGLAERATELHRLVIDVEDKGLSLALHYRRSPNPAASRALLNEALQPHGHALRVEDGHCVVNAMAADAPHKGDALRELLDGWALDCALVLGDDRNDEPAFAAAPAGSVGVYIGAAARPTAAQFRLDAQTQVDCVLDLLLRFRRAEIKLT